jgi:V8-like Glu-specific endopeptidase
LDLKAFEEQAFFLTIRIQVRASRTGASIGTGFIVHVPVAPGRSCLLLISNKHVYHDSKKPISLVFHKKSTESADRPSLEESIPISLEAFDSIYTEHPDPSIDLACLSISRIGDPDMPVFHNNLSLEMLAAFDEEKLLPGMDVWFVGYPENRYDTVHNLPIMRKGSVASIPKVDFQDKRQFLIDAQVFPGSSGSPVFAAISGHMRLIGVVTQTMIKNEKLQAVPVTMAMGVQQPLGLGIVLKATLLHEFGQVAT